VKRAGWFGLTIAAIGLWGLYGIALKRASDGLSTVAGQLFSTVGLLLPALFLAGSVARERGAVAGLMVGFVSGLCGALGNFSLLASLGAGSQAAIVFPLTALYPLITVVIAVLFMRERAGRIQVFGIGLAIIAVLLLSVDVSASYARVDLKLSRALLYAFAALVAFGLAAVFQKLATNRVSAETAFATFAAGFIPPSILILLLGPVGANLQLAPVLWAIAGGLLNGSRRSGDVGSVSSRGQGVGSHAAGRRLSHGHGHSGRAVSGREVSWRTDRRNCVGFDRRGSLVAGIVSTLPDRRTGRRRRRC
jgi:drug/metabolite transporter (DMT)-like permease